MNEDVAHISREIRNVARLIEREANGVFVEDVPGNKRMAKVTLEAIHGFTLSSLRKYREACK